ncbi:PAS domain S-box protein [Nocardioides sp.]|uniref:PAS domain S-box protein n=1 Tax=Nocardioides sp. TaxID=35761 RepID=UPI00286E09D5|nr:PAS domain S-box protein [Nocardioides sp.]
MSATDPTSDARFQDLDALLAAAPDAMLLADQRGHIVQLNDRCAQLFGYDRAEMVGQSVEVLIPAHQRDLHRRQRAVYGARPSIREMSSGLDLVGLRKDGSRVPVDISLAPFETDHGALVLAAVRDVSRSRSGERLFRRLVEAAPDAIVVADGEGRIQLVNARAVGMFGYEASELIGQSVVTLMPERLADAYETLRVGYLADPDAPPVIGLSGGLFGRRKDGTEVPVEVSLAPLETDDGTLFLADVRDITERIENLAAIREAEERQQVQEATNRAKDAFLATVSHELRTPLASILGYAELMADSGHQTPENAHFTAVIIRNARRELRLVQDLLTLSTIAEGGLEVHPARVDLVEVVRHAVESALPAAGETGVSVVAVVPDAPLWADCDQERIAQVLDSLLSNALKFTPSGGDVILRLSRQGYSARLEVADSGVGIGDEEPSRVFERLYRSRTAIANEVPGAGIGLTIAAAIIKAHRGTIRVLSTSDSGTTFGIDIPLGQ